MSRLRLPATVALPDSRKPARQPTPNCERGISRSYRLVTRTATKVCSRAALAMLAQAER